ncbi:hypothetical protein QTG54_004887 [Skeletonema marinoi]|uniref:Uncharacterized protein n=1 Tax=Skeletonema marinoi TaxID=267567 RepID=A0AAD8YDA4_9STRA|nr:hypothetical protein QTG54_004887 [Skeletonema marinoi]
MVKSTIILSAAAMASCAYAFAPQQVVVNRNNNLVSSSTTAMQASRRDFFIRAGSTALVTLTTATINSSPAVAATTPPTAEEIERIKVGYKNIQYLLDNWEQETTVCRENGGECKRDADAARRAMGLRSTTDPLFQIEKVFNKVKYMEDIDLDKLEQFFEATEDWNTAMNMSNSMAFISQFAEYNPGGGKDEVLKYLNEAEIQVKLAEKALSVILDCVTSSPQ